MKALTALALLASIAAGGCSVGPSIPPVAKVDIRAPRALQGAIAAEIVRFGAANSLETLQGGYPEGNRTVWQVDLHSNECTFVVTGNVQHEDVVMLTFYDCPGVSWKETQAKLVRTIKKQFGDQIVVKSAEPNGY